MAKDTSAADRRPVDSSITDDDDVEGHGMVPISDSMDDPFGPLKR